MKFALHSHIGTLRDGGVRLIGTYRWLFWAKLVGWFHVRMVNPYRAITVHAVKAKAALSPFCESQSVWQAQMKSAV